MLLSNKLPHLFLVLLLSSSVFMQGCSYIPWLKGSQEEDIAFEDDFGTEDGEFADKEGGKGGEDDFFGETEGEFLNVDEQFPNPAQETAKSELKGDVENLQSQQGALAGKVRQMEEMLKTLEPKISATEQRLQGSLAAAKGKTEFLEPEVEQLKKQVAALNAEIARLKEIEAKEAAAMVAKKEEVKKKRTMRRKASPVPPEYSRALAAYRAKNYDESILLFQSLSVSNPPANLQDNIAFWIGSNYVQLEMFDDAIKQFEMVLNKFSRGNKVHDSRYMLALSYHKMGQSSKAVEILQSALKSKPNQEVRVKMEKMLNEIR
ncbi:MAG: hypothetical protein COV66_13665 [Nitrospinae bacterium CG11_big_fil_rev_8_21_14_0_20_45_15]|nr:MAG: hypothetical protein COV66_13665 [Nitrospinae bacterium CG11_big_fil_rev_8_21_14_0_20_45_15]